MAKKYRESILSIIELIVYSFYYGGISISLIFHTSLFLLLSLLFISEPIIKTPIILSIPQSIESESTSEPFPDMDKVQIISLDESNDYILPESLIYDNQQIVLKEHFSNIESTHIPYYGFDNALLIENNEILTDFGFCSNSTSSSGQIDQILIYREGSSSNHSVTEGSRLIIGEIQDRVKKHGGKTGDIQISLSWNTKDDLDLHATVEPVNSDINWTNKKGRCGGILDIDMNARQKWLTDKPIENIFWKTTRYLKYRYTIKVHFYMNWTKAVETEARILLKIDNKLELIPIRVRFGEKPKTIISFDR